MAEFSYPNIDDAARAVELRAELAGLQRRLEAAQSGPDPRDALRTEVERARAALAQVEHEHLQAVARLRGAADEEATAILQAAGVTP